MKKVLLILLINTFLCACAQTEKNDPHKEGVILLHGFARSKTAMWRLAGRLEDAGYSVHRIGYDSLTQDIDAIKKEVFFKINSYMKNRSNRVHFVGHSFGGLLIRSYLGENKVKNIGNVVLMGSPSKGTPAVDYLKDKWYFKYAGPSIMTMSSRGSAFLSSLKEPDYNLGIIAGVSESSSNESILNGKNDGIVPIESTKVSGMKDFIIIETSHTMMRYSEDVAEQTIYFLRNGVFLK